MRKAKERGANISLQRVMRINETDVMTAREVLVLCVPFFMQNDKAYIGYQQEMG